MNKLVDEAPYHPGYEDAVMPPKSMYKGMNPDKMLWKPKPLSDEEICLLWKTSQEDGVGMSLGYTTQEHYFARLIEAKVRGEK